MKTAGKKSGQYARPKSSTSLARILRQTRTHFNLKLHEDYDRAPAMPCLRAAIIYFRSLRHTRTKMTTAMIPKTSNPIITANTITSSLLPESISQRTRFLIVY